MANTVSFSPYGGDTIKALQARQQALQQGAPQLPSVNNMRSPWQGASHMANTLVNTLQQNAAAAQERDARQQLSQIIAGHKAGDPWQSAEIANAMQLDPELGTHIMDLEAARALASTKEDQWKPIPTPAGENGQWFQNQAGDTKKVGGGSPGEGGWKPSDIAGRADDYMKAAATYNVAAPSWQSMNEAYKVATSPGDDVAGKGTADYNIIVAFAKMLDPNSVVRETEVDSASMTEGQIGMLESWLAQWNQDGMLSDGARKGIMTQASSRMNAYHSQAKQYRDWITGVATRNKVNPDDVVPPLPDFTPWTDQPPPDPANPAPDPANPAPTPDTPDTPAEPEIPYIPAPQGVDPETWPTEEEWRTLPAAKRKALQNIAPRTP